MMWWNDGMGWGGWTAMIVVMVAFWALVIFGLMATFGSPGEGKQQTEHPTWIRRTFFANASPAVRSAQTNTTCAGRLSARTNDNTPIFRLQRYP